MALEKEEVAAKRALCFSSEALDVDAIAAEERRDGGGRDVRVLKEPVGQGERGSGLLELGVDVRNEFRARGECEFAKLLCRRARSAGECCADVDIVGAVREPWSDASMRRRLRARSVGYVFCGT